MAAPNVPACVERAGAGADLDDADLTAFDLTAADLTAAALVDAGFANAPEDATGFVGAGRTRLIGGTIASTGPAAALFS